MSDEIYLIPEIHSTSPFFWAGSAEQITLMPIPISGIKLYADTKELDSYASKRTIIVVEQQNKASKLYPVRFTKILPKFEKYGYSIKKCPHGNIVYMEYENFWKINSDSSFVSIADGDWLCNKRHFKTIAALYHLSLLPSLNKAVFKTEINEDIENQLRMMYDVSGNVLESLTSIFKNVLFGLEYFGFCNDLTERQKKLLNHIKERIKVKPICIAFSQIDFAIQNYNRKCYGIASSRMRCFSYLHLVKTINIVEKFINQMGFLDDCNDRFASLIQNTKNFQKHFNLPETGMCDSATLRKLWDQTIVKGVNIKSVMEFAGFKPRIPPPTQYLMSTDESDNPTEIALVENINRFIGKIPITANATELLRTNINGRLFDITQRTGRLSQRVNNLVTRFNCASKILKKVEDSNSRCDEALETASLVLNNVLEDHIKVQQQFVAIRESITAQKKRNKVLQFFGAILFLYYIYRLIRVL